MPESSIQLPFEDKILHSQFGMFSLAILRKSRTFCMGCHTKRYLMPRIIQCLFLLAAPTPGVLGAWQITSRTLCTARAVTSAPIPDSSLLQLRNSPWSTDLSSQPPRLYHFNHSSRLPLTHPSPSQPQQPAMHSASH